MIQPSICVEVTDLVKTYSRGRIRALDGVSLSVRPGEIFGLIGPNGAGKTTLIGCLLGLLRPDSGEVRIEGKLPTHLKVHEIIGYVPERPDFEHWMTAKQFLLYHHGLARREPSAAEKEIAEALECVELPWEAWHRRLKTYSRGMLQRLNLAQLIIGQPRLLLLDEPTLGLDPTGVALVRRLVMTAKEAGSTAIINSHQLDEIERICDRVAFIKSGKIGSIETLKGESAGNYVLACKWANPQFDGNLAVTLSEIAKRCGVTLMDNGDCSARFVVRDNQAAAQLIKDLVTSGLWIEEAYPERARLEKLFLEDRGAGANE